MRNLYLLVLILSTTALLQAQLESTDDGYGVNAISYRTALEQKAFALINQYRLSEHLPALEWNPAIAQTARSQSQDMSNGSADFCHTNFRQRMVQLKSTMGNLRTAAENFFQGGNSDQVAERAVQTWLAHPQQVKAICGNFNCSGVGVWINDQKAVFFTQVFVRTAELTTTAPASSPQGWAPSGMALHAQ